MARVLAVVLALASCLAVASALPKHPFFTEQQLAKAQEGYSDYDQRLCLQGKSACFANVDGPFDFTLGVDCCRDDYHYGSERIAQATSNAGWCLFNQDLTFVEVPGSSVVIASTFDAQCYLHSDSRDCNLEQCDDAVVHVEGVVMYDFAIVFDSNPVGVLAGCSGGGDNRQRQGSNKAATPVTQSMWVEAMAKALNLKKAEEKKAEEKTPAKVANNGGHHQLYETDGTLWFGIATTYDSHGKLLGTGSFNYNVPFNFANWVDTIDHSELNGRKVYSPHQIRTSVNAVKGGHYAN